MVIVEDVYLVLDVENMARHVKEFRRVLHGRLCWQLSERIQVFWGADARAGDIKLSMSKAVGKEGGQRLSWFVLVIC
eukprot:m.312826 g.312826  ORF g.312826 m.312826 type:complete len:77 (+) comp312770_c0_seq1:98-328(+)